MDNRISGTLTSEDVKRLVSMVEELKSSMPFMAKFTAEEIIGMPKLTGTSLEFVKTAVEAAQNLQDYLPRSFDRAEFRRDFELFMALEAIRKALEPVWRMVNDTQVAVGSDAMEAAMAVYAGLKRAPQESGAAAYVELLKGHMVLKRSVSSSEETLESVS